MKILPFAGLIFLFILGCQTKPTQVLSEAPILTEAGLTEKKFTESQWLEKAVLLDARTPFEFNLSHVPGAINLRWEDFSQQNSRTRGLLETDLFSLARRLSLIGIDPDTKVVVLGKGVQGQGEEGRIAWTLQVLGVKEVHTLLHTTLRSLNLSDQPTPQNKSYWKPQVNEALLISLKDLKSLLDKKSDLVILDVRMPEEFKLRNLSQIPHLKADVINIEWKNFFDEQGLPSKSIEDLLAKNALKKSSQIVVISNHGVRSAAVTYALYSMGFSHARNFAGGYEQWK